MLTDSIPVKGLHAKERVALCLGRGGGGGGGLPTLFLSHPQVSDTSLHSGQQTTQFLEGTEVGAEKRKQETREEKKKDGQGILSVYINPTLKKKISTHCQFHTHQLV